MFYLNCFSIFQESRVTKAEHELQFPSSATATADGSEPVWRLQLQLCSEFSAAVVPKPKLVTTSCVYIMVSCGFLLS